MEREIENTWVKMQRVGESMDSLAFSSKPSSPSVGRGGKQGKKGAKARRLQIWCLEVGGLSGGFYLFLFLVKQENDSDGRKWGRGDLRSGEKGLESS